MPFSIVNVKADSGGNICKISWSYTDTPSTGTLTGEWSILPTYGPFPATSTTEAEIITYVGSTIGDIAVLDATIARDAAEAAAIASETTYVPSGSGGFDPA